MTSEQVDSQSALCSAPAHKCQCHPELTQVHKWCHDALSKTVNDSEVDTQSTVETQS